MAVVIPHHDIVRSTRQDFLKSISRRRLLTRKIVILSPDHYSANQSRITTSDSDWELSTGTYKSADYLHLNLPVENSLLHNDHGLYNPLADLRTYFPRAVIEPVLIGQNVNPEALSGILQNLKTYCGFDCLLVASVDFSHYLPAMLAETHDAFTLNRLYNLDTAGILKAEVDSPQSLYLLTFFAAFKNSRRFNLFAHTNSGVLAHDPDIETTSHVFGSYTRGVPVRSDVKTEVTMPVALEPHSQTKTVGDRFFIGADKLTVSNSYPGFISAIIFYRDRSFTSFFPLNSDNTFLRGPEKQTLINRLLNSFSNTKNLTKDNFWGTLNYIYETKP